VPTIVTCQLSSRANYRHVIGSAPSLLRFRRFIEKR
jgi:hypothetical protein